MYQLNNLKPAQGAKKKKRRVGRGPGSGAGTTASRGNKGARSRSGGGMGAWFEGGQMPLYRRVPKKGFFSRNRVENQCINLSMFERFDAGETITPEYLASKGLVSGRNPRVKILGNGEVSGSFKIHVHAVSKSAREKIEAAGGSIEILPWSSTAGKVDAKKVSE